MQISLQVWLMVFPILITGISVYYAIARNKKSDLKNVARMEFKIDNLCTVIGDMKEQILFINKSLSIIKDKLGEMNVEAGKHGVRIDALEKKIRS
jgi:uncharacterized membrane-anchored protein YhcB (DUF1043 family)